MQIKDLDLAREMSAEEQGAVSGGDNTSLIYNGPVSAISGFGVGNTAVAVGPVNNVTQLDNDVKVDIDTNTVTNNLVGSLAQIAQFVG